MSKKTILIWYRNDLRLHDHEPLYQALQAKASVIPLYCFDERQFGTTSFGFPKTGAFRAQFILESVADLRNSLRSQGSDLIVCRGLPEKIIPLLAKSLNIWALYYHREVTSEELAVESALKKALSQIGVKVQSFWGTTLFHINDLPFSIPQIPEIFTQFRKRVEKSSTVAPTFPTPESLPPLPEIEVGKIPKLADFGLEPPSFDQRAVLNFKGGETAALARLEHYFWKQDYLKAYKQTRNGMLGADYSSKFSPWLALGCLS
ncbi:MAG: cryptochrome DASH, partial [Symploca sp. SIO1C4]|nr:cryptochrome DASH [Symploca sp. SIO1C4]